MKLPRLASVIPFASLIVVHAAHAGGFALNEMSAASVGNAHAGVAAVDDISTIYYNPAGLTRFSGQQFMIAGSGIKPSAKFNNRGSTSAVGTPLTGGNGGDAGSWAAVPAIFYSRELSPSTSFGIGITSPFGLVTEYDGNWVGRYQALKSSLMSVDINPSIAYKVNDQVSVGAGISAQYVDVELSKAVDFGTVCIAAAGPATCSAIGFLPQTKDGKATVKGNDWGFGFNLGAMFTPTENTRFGLAYRSKISHGVSGDATYDKPAGLPGPIGASPTFTNTSASASLDLPESFSANGFIQIDPKWSVMGDVTWMRWSRLKELRVSFANGAADSVTPEQWRDTTRVSAAVNYRYNDIWKFRAGVAWDQSPVKDEFRTPRIPDADRTWLAFGVQYKASPRDTWDFGYAHLFVKDGPINKSETGAGTLVGNYTSDVNIVSVQYSRSF